MAAPTTTVFRIVPIIIHISCCISTKKLSTPSANVSHSSIILKSKPAAQGTAGDTSSKRDTPAKFLEQLNMNVNGCIQEALSYLTTMDYFSTYKSRIDQLDHLITACGNLFQDWSAVLQLEKAKAYHKWAITEMERSKNYAIALHCLKECYSPLEIIRTLVPEEMDVDSDEFDLFTSDQFTVDHREDLDDLINSIRADTAVAEAMRLIEDGDNRLKSSILDSEHLDVDGVHDSLDNYRAAIVTLHDWNGSDLILEAEAFSKTGQIYFNVLKNEEQGKANCMIAVQLAATVDHVNFAGKEWYDKAAAILKHIQDEKRRKDEEEVRKCRDPFLKALEKELTELNQLGEKSAETLLTELPKKFPPKHKADSRVLTDLAKTKFTSDTPRSDVKKALSKLILLYHPDHVDIKTYGGEYYVLC